MCIFAFMLYRLLKAIVWTGVRLFYREVKIVNKHYLNFDGPAIIIANHPNTIMDAWMMGYANDRRVYFMAKSTFFSSPFKKKILNALGMIPINRKSDGAVAGVNNKDSFEACYSLLEKGEILVVFPEGTSYLERKLRELKTGTARIALEVEKRNQGKLGLKIVPIGLNYIDASSYRGKVMVHVGKPFKIDSNDLELYATSAGKAAKSLTEEFRVALSRVFVSLEDSEKEKLSEEIAFIIDDRKQRGKKGVNQSIRLLQKISAGLDEMSLTAPYKLEEAKQITQELLESIRFLGIRPDWIGRKYRSTMYSRQMVQSVLFLLLTLPVALFGLLHNFIPYYFIGWILPRITRDEEYHAPLAILMGLILYPLIYAGFAVGFSFFGFGFWVLLAYLVALPLTGIFAHFYARYWRHIGSKFRFTQILRKRRQIFEDLKAKKARLNSLILGE